MAANPHIWNRPQHNLTLCRDLRSAITERAPHSSVNSFGERPRRIGVRRIRATRRRSALGINVRVVPCAPRRRRNAVPPALPGDATSLLRVSPANELPARSGITTLGELTAALTKQASGRALSYLFGTARPLTCILWKRPQHKPTLYAPAGFLAGSPPGRDSREDDDHPATLFVCDGQQYSSVREDSDRQVTRLHGHDVLA